MPFISSSHANSRGRTLYFRPMITRQDMRRQESLRRLDELSKWLDSRWRLPGTSIHFGLDALIGLLPGIGDSAGALFSLWLIYEARQLNLPWWVKWRMGGNILIDWLIGLVPLAGDMLDIAWKANRRNLELIRRHVNRPGE